jgi:hypothetical protein
MMQLSCIIVQLRYMKRVLFTTATGIPLVYTVSQIYITILFLVYPCVCVCVGSMWNVNTITTV